MKQRSHDTLFRQSNGNFDEIIKEISFLLKHDSYQKYPTAHASGFTAKANNCESYTKRTAGYLDYTGLSGVGKTTLAQELIKLIIVTGEQVIHLDGDKLREIFGVVERIPKTMTAIRASRLAMKYSKLTNVLCYQGFTVVVSTISMFNEIYDWNRTNLPNYFEVYLKIPLDELRRRDPKTSIINMTEGIKNVAGLDLLVDEPLTADWQPEFQRDRTVSMLACRQIQF